MILSIIIPVYRAEKFLNRCIESILTQNVDDMEVILVDDGSPDNSGKLCDEWSGKDCRIRVIHKSNGGPGSARNMALDIAKGTYVTFIDSDDAIADNTLLPLMTYMSKHINCDILEYPAHLYIGSKKERKLTFTDTTFDISSPDKKKNFWLNEHLYTHCYSCNKVFRRSIFDNIRYPEKVALGEDIRMMAHIIQKANTYSTTNLGQYLYYFNNESISGALKYADELLFSHIYAIEQLGIDIYSETAHRLYLTLLNGQIDVYRFSKTEPTAPILKNNNVPLSCARNKVELIKILLVRTIGVKLLCKLYRKIPVNR